MPVVKAKGAKLEYGNQDTYAASTTWTAIAKLQNLRPPQPEYEDLDTTDLDAADDARTFEAGLLDGGEVEATLVYDKTLSETVNGLMGQSKGFRVQFSDASGWKFNGYLKGDGNEEVAVGDYLRQNVRIKVSGKPVRDATVTA